MASLTEATADLAIVEDKLAAEAPPAATETPEEAKSRKRAEIMAKLAKAKAIKAAVEHPPNLDLAKPVPAAARLPACLGAPGCVAAFRALSPPDAPDADCRSQVRHARGNHV